MITTDVVIVGGGPAGSSCAWRLKQHGVDCLILERQEFPRLKLCAGWITPEVVSDLAFDPAEYPHSFLSFDKLRIHIRGLNFSFKTVQHSIRRYEFDAWLLQRSQAPVHTHYAKDIRREGGYYVIDGEYRAKYLVGAGGTKCPVYRTLFRDLNPRAKELQAVTLEHEFPYQWQDRDCHLWFFDEGLPGYSWYVPKANGHLNVGVGGMAFKLKRRGDDIKHHWNHLSRVIQERGLITDQTLDPGGYSYYLRGNVDTVHHDNAFIVGDAVGLATRDLCEGIGPAVRSGLLAADAIALGSDYRLDSIGRYSAAYTVIGKLLDYFMIKRGIQG